MIVAMIIEVSVEEMERDVDRFIQYVDEGGATIHVIVDGERRVEIRPYSVDSQISKIPQDS